MAIVKMKKLRMVALSSEKVDLLKHLQRLSCLEIRQFPAPESLADPGAFDDNSERIKELKRMRADAEKALKLLKKYAYVKSGLFSNRDLISRDEFFSGEGWDEAVSSVRTILDADERLSVLRGEELAAGSLMSSLSLWKDCSVPFELDHTSSSRVMLGSIPAFKDTDAFSSALEQADGEVFVSRVGGDRDRTGLMLVCSNESLTALQPVLRDYGYEPAPVEGMTGTAKDNIVSASRSLDSLRADGDELLTRLSEQGASRRRIKLLYDRLTMEIDMAEADEKLANTAAAFALTGWVPEPDVPALENLLGKYCCAYELSDPEPDDTVPVKLKNNRLTEPLNMVTEMYSLPDYRGIDPNPLITPFFCIFFGMMFNDLGYGLVFIIASLIIRSKVRLRGTMKYMMGLVLMCGVTTSIMGLITGSFFGDSITVIASMFGREITLPSMLDPLSDPMKVLIISVAFGAVHIIFGMAVKAYMLIRDGHPLDALFDVGSWWLLFAGIAVLATGGTYWIAVAGVAALLLTQGRAKPTVAGKIIGGLASLYDITSYLSDVLSYSRIMALMLAGGIVASIVNILGSLPGSIILFIPIFIIGHVFNIGINVIGTYVHAARLQYLEFFGKFYVDGGRAFRPLGIKTKYFDIVEEDQA